MPILKKVVGLAGLCVSWLMITASSADTPPPVRIMPLGDSLTSGVTWSSEQSGFTFLHGYRERLYDLLSNNGYNVDFVGTVPDTLDPQMQDSDHEGHGGYRIDEIDAGVEEWLSDVDDPDVILLLIGTNDFYQNYNTAEAPERLGDLIAKIATFRPFAKILLANLPLRLDDPLKEAGQSAYNASLPGVVSNQVALGRQVYLVDGMHSSFDASGLSGDGVHPNQDGYDGMADTWLPEIVNVISPLGTADPPAMVRATPIDFQHVAVTFSKPLEDAAADVAHFNLSGGATISQATLDPSTKRTITLVTSLLTDGVEYTLSASGIRDRTPQHHEIAAASTMNFIAERVINGSFEMADLTGWVFSGNISVVTGNSYPTTDGFNVLVFNAGQSAPNGVISQSIATIAGQTYNLQFDVGTIAYTTSEQRLEVTVQGNGNLFSDTVSILGPGNGSAWVTPSPSYTFMANSAITTLTFRDVSPTSQNLDLLLDNVRVSASSPNNTPPVFTTDPIAGAGATQDLPYGGTITGFASDVDEGDPIAYSKTNGPSWLLVSNDGTLSGTPGNSDVGANAFIVRVTDEAGAYDEAVLNIDVANVNDAPVANAQSVSASLNGSVAITLTGTDMDGDSLAFAVEDEPAHGTVGLVGSVATYMPDPGFSGTDSFTFTAHDGMASSLPANISITTERLVNGSFEFGFTGWAATGSQFIESGAPYTTTDGANLVTFNGNRVDDYPPDAVLYQSFPTTPGASYTLFFDIGVYAANTATQQLRVTLDGTVNLLSQVASISGAGGLTIQWSPRSYSFVANSAVTTLTFRDISTITNGIDVLLDHVRVEQVSVPNSAPVADNDSYLTSEDMVLDIAAPGLLANDTDAESDGLTAVKVTDPANGIAVVNANGGFTYTPGPDFNGVDSFTYKANDGSLDSNVATVMVSVAAINDAPVAAADGKNTDEDTALIFTASDLLSNDTTGPVDESGQTLTVTAVSATSAEGGTVTLVAGEISYTPPSDFNGSDSFTYTIEDDGVPAASANGTVTVTVAAINDAPVAATDNKSTDEDVELLFTASDLLTNDTPGPVDESGQSLTVTGVSASSVEGGTVTLVAGEISYTPPSDFNGSDSFSYTIEDDGVPIESSNGTVTVTVTAINDAPVATTDDKSTDEDVELLFTASDLLTNDTPGPVDENTQTLTITGVSVSSAEGGVVSLVAGEISYTPPVDFNGSDSFSYTVEDDGSPAASSNGTVNVTVAAINDAPVAVADGKTTDEDIELLFTASDLLSNDTTGPADESAQTLTVTAVSASSAEGGVVTLVAGEISYTPPTDFNGSDSFTYTVEDDGSPAASANGTVNVTVAAINDAPVAGADGKNTDEDIELLFTAADLLSNDSTGPVDESGQTLTVTGVSASSAEGGVVSLVAGEISYTPPADFNGSDSFTYTVEDNGSPAASANGTVNVTVAAINDAPVAGADSKTTDEDTALLFTASDLLSNDTTGPADESGQTLTVTGVSASSAEGGVVTLVAGEISYTPPTGFNGSDSFTYTVEDDGSPVANSNGTVTVAVNPQEEYTQWMDGFGLASSPGVDSDNDGIMNAVEYVIGGNPANQNDANLLPLDSLVTADPDQDLTNDDYFLFTYRRTDLANNDSSTAITVQWTEDLSGGWTDAVGAPGVVIEELNDAAEDGVDLVKVYIPRSFGEKLFARLSVAINMK